MLNIKFCLELLVTHMLLIAYLIMPVFNSQLITKICVIIATVILDSIILILHFKFKESVNEVNEHKILSAFYYIALLVGIVGISCSIFLK